ncbi:hypothetical protein [Salinispora oceanensis]|uniref:hypothetical protein n=1 Tax=Salinispora oceanensis TaxID=1050199 RepID=UPI00037B83EA|nr:hypothetical protein [Salinispora oceanensis]
MSIIARTTIHPRVQVTTTAPGSPALIAARWVSDHRTILGYGTLTAGVEAAILAVGYTTGGPIVGAALGSLLPGLAAVTGTVAIVSRKSVARHAQITSDDHGNARNDSA